MNHYLGSFLLLVFWAYLLLLVYFFCRQRQLLYCCDGERPQPEELVSCGLEFWPAAGGDDDYLGLLSPPPAGEKLRGLVVLFHGNAGRALERHYFLPPLLAQGFRVLLVEYPGYGGRPGWPSEALLVAEAGEILRRLRAEFPSVPLYLWGESLGCGVAAGVAAAGPVRPAGVVMLTPWDSLVAVAGSFYWYLPVRWLLRDRYDNLANLRRYRGPVAILVAGRDRTVPPRFGRRLYAGLPEPKKLWLFPAADHSAWPRDPGEKWWAEVMAFLSRGS